MRQALEEILDLATTGNDLVADLEKIGEIANVLLSRMLESPYLLHKADCGKPCDCGLSTLIAEANDALHAI